MKSVWKKALACECSSFPGTNKPVFREDGNMPYPQALRVIWSHWVHERFHVSSLYATGSIPLSTGTLRSMCCTLRLLHVYQMPLWVCGSPPSFDFTRALRVRCIGISQSSSIRSDCRGQSLATFNFRTVTSKFNKLVYRYPIRIPERYALVIRSLLTQV